MNYDSMPDTVAHITRVQDLMDVAINKLCERAQVHDASKLREPEKGTFDYATPRLAGSTYGSPEYKGFLVELKPALAHHYAANSHHPEHYANGVDGMSLLDVLEMLCDWKAAGERHKDGSIARSLKLNRERFKVSDQLQAILENTAIEMGWCEPEAAGRAAAEAETPKLTMNCPRCDTENSEYRTLCRICDANLVPGPTREETVATPAVESLYDALSRDQCVKGFQHTEDTLLDWLCGCTDDAVESLHRRITDHLEDIRSIRRRAESQNMRTERSQEAEK